MTAQTAAEFNTLKISGAHAFTLAAGQIVNVNGLLKTGANATLSGGSFIRPSPSADLVVRTPIASDALTINTVIRDNVGSALVKSGLGTLTLGALGVNNYTGGTFLNEGTLIVAQDSNLGSTISENNVRLNGGTLQPAANIALHANHGLDIGPGGGAIFGNGFGLTLGSANMLSGSGPLAVTGVGNTNTILTSAATQDYTGPLTLGANSFFAGRIALGADNLVNPFGTGDLTVISGAAGSAVWVNRPGSQWNNRFTISGNGAESRGVLRTTEGGTFNGDIVLAGDASISSDGIGTTTVLRGDVSGAFTLTVGGRTGANASNVYSLTGNNVHAATIVGLGITRIDHDVALGAYQGTTTIQSGATLQAGAGVVVLNPDRTVALTGGGLHTLDSQNNSFSVQGRITGGASDTLVLRGVSVRLNAANTYTGATVIDGGTVIVDTLGNAGTPSNLGQGSPNPTAADLIFRDSKLLLAPTVPISTDRLFTIDGTSATLDASASVQPVRFTNPGAIGHSGTAPRRLVLTGNNGNGGDNIFTPSLGDAGIPQEPIRTGLTKSGPNTWVVNGVNTFTGTTEIDDGTLALRGSGSVARSPKIAVASGATFNVSGVTGGANFDGSRFAVVSGQTLQGTGTVVGALNVSAGGTLAPGNSIGTLSIDSLSLTSANSVFKLEIDLGRLTPAADLLNVTGSLTLASSTLDLSLFNLSPMGLPKTFLVVQNDSIDPISGSFDTITGVPVGYTAFVDYAFSGTDLLGRVGTGNDMAITFAVDVVPEPSTAAWGLALGLIAFSRRARIRAQGERPCANTASVQ